MIASHYAIKEILKDWGNTKVVKERFEELAKRYPEDKEFQEIYNEFKEYLNLSAEKLEKIKMKVHNLEI